jgi:hypothetical protein
MTARGGDASMPKSRAVTQGELTPRERKVLEGKAKGLSTAAAMRAAGYSDGYSKSGGTLLMDRLRETFHEVLVRRGFTPDAFLDKLERLLEAKKYIVGAPEHERFQPDNTTQFYTLKLWADLAGYEPPKKTISDVNLSITDRRAEQRQIWDRLGGLS